MLIKVRNTIKTINETAVDIIRSMRAGSETQESERLLNDVTACFSNTTKLHMSNPMDLNRYFTENEKTEEDIICIKNALENASNAIWVTDRRAEKIIYHNKAFKKLFKYTGEELNITGGAPVLFCDPATAWYVYETVKNNAAVSLEALMKTSGNRILFISLYGDVIKNSAGRIIAYIGIATDITEKKHIENELIESRQKMTDIIQFFPDPVMAINSEGKVTEWNRSMENLTGVKTADILGKGDYEYAVPFYDERKPMLIDLALGSEKEAEKKYDKFERCGAKTKGEMYIPDLRGREAYLAGSAIALYRPGGEISGAIESIRDITENRRSEEMLRKSEENYRVLFKNMQDIFIRVDHNGNITSASPSISQLGYEPEEVKGLNAGKEFYFFAQDREILLKNMEEKGSITDYETQFKNKDSNPMWVAISSHFNYDEHGNITGTDSIIRDITRRKKAEEELLIEKELLSVTLKSICDGIIVTDLFSHVILINNSAEKLMGWKQDEVTGKPLMSYFNIINAKTKIRDKDIVITALKAGGLIKIRRNTILINKNGCEYMISGSSAPVRDNNGKKIGVIIIFRDITEKLQMEEELLKAQKLESLSTFAGGIAHDFNNILTGIMGNISLLLMKTRPDNRDYSILARVEKASLRAKDLTQQLITFSKGWAPIRKPVLINNLLKDSVTFILTGSNIKCLFSFEDDLWPVEIDESQVVQVINNLVINSKQAMPDGGIIEIKSENINIYQKNYIPLREGRYVKISIQDQGAGIPEDIHAKIFDPFFTTKAAGHGLGLSTSYSIIRKHDGYIKFESGSGTGSTFFIYLPASDKHLNHGNERTDIKTFKIKKKILLMDDEEIIRETASQMLEYIGLEAESAEDGNQAIKMYLKAAEAGMPYDAIIMDLTIPGGMGGVEAVKKLHMIDPQARVIASSGYSNDPVMSDFRKYGFIDILVKPYKTDELYNTIVKLFE